MVYGTYNYVWLLGIINEQTSLGGPTLYDWMNELIIIFQKEWVIATPPKPRHQQVGHLDFFEVKYLQVLSGFHIFRYLFDEL